ncbi:MAG TPA: DnaJ domain-containing protein [Exilispira sp.]|nr:DnaJ domain-containing protein [Exilispira sp.]
MNEIIQDYYSILNVTPDSSTEEIKKAYRKLVFKFHPDRNKDPSAIEMFKTISKAFSVLSNSKTRLEYDIAIEDQYKIQLFKNNFSDIFIKLDNSVKEKLGDTNKKLIKEYKIDESTLNLSFAELMQRLFHSSNIYTQQSAAQALIKKDHRIAYSILIRFIKNEKIEENVMFILKLLAKSYGNMVFADLFSFLLNSSKNVKLTVLNLLNDNFCEKGSEICVKYLEDESSDVRLYALKILNKNDKELVLQKIYNLLNDPDKKVLVEAKDIYNTLKREIKKAEEK